MYKVSLTVIVVALVVLIGYNLMTPNVDGASTSINLKANEIKANTQSSLASNSNINNSTNTNMQNTNTNAQPNSNVDITNLHTVTLDTSMGKITIELAKDKPATTANFLKLVTSKFYDGIKFHRVIDGFMIQGGDPLSKDDNNKQYWGTGGPGYKFNDELTGKEEYKVGTVAMANSGPNTNGSQFFIMVADVPLPPSYTVFGRVTSGLENVLKIGTTPTDPSDKPLTAVVINSAVAK